MIEYNAKKMSSAFVYSLLAVLLIAVHFTMAFPSNVHERMTRAERLAVFGSEDSVPEYQVFPMSLPGTRHRRETNEPLILKIILRGKKLNLTLTPTEGNLATKYTPVFSAKSDGRAYQNIRYDPLPTAMSDVGEFKMYHDVENEAAVTTYADPTEGTIIEGIISPYYAIRSLPKRLMDETLTVGREIIRKRYPKKRSITSDEEKEHSGHFVVFKVQAASNLLKPSALVDPNDLQREKRASDAGERQRVPKAVYPEILLVLDHNAIRDHTMTQALRFMLAFWNGVDLVYRAFDEPKAHLNFVGIIIAADDLATPYIASSVSVNFLGDRDVVVSNIGKYFYKEKARFPVNSYDMIIAMTTIEICEQGTVGECYSMYEHDNPNTACLPPSEVSRTKTIKNNGIVGYNWQFTGIITAVQASAHILGAQSDNTENDADGTKKCPPNNGHVMAQWNTFGAWTFKWSKCSRTFFSQYFSSNKSQCLDNKPLWTEEVGEVLPGRWMSMDGQCRNEGFAKACRLENTSMCVAKGCRAKGSDECTRTEGLPLLGSKCGKNMHCNAEQQCVHN